MVEAGSVLWTPSPARIERARLVEFQRWLAEHRGLAFPDFESMWRWSTTDIDGFWQACWDFFGIEATAPPRAVLGRRTMPGAEWFPGAELNYARHVLRHERPNATAVLHRNERQPLRAISWEELGGQVRIVATRLRALGVKRGDRVCAYIVNVPEALIAMLATTSLGAIWSSCGPHFGTPGVLDRFSQLEPTVLIHVDGYQYGGKQFDRRPDVEHMLTRLTSVQHVIQLPYLDPSEPRRLTPDTIFWHELLDLRRSRATTFVFEEVPFDHPLWILFSSGTTGLPKAIVQSHGGTLIEQLKHLAFNFDMRAGERIFFFTTTGWMMWNFLVSSLLSNVVPVLYDGNPAWPDGDILWRMVQDAKANLFGASPAYQAVLEKNGVVPKAKFDLSPSTRSRWPARPSRPSATPGSTTTSKQDCGWRPAAAARTSAPGSSAGASSCRSGRRDAGALPGRGRPRDGRARRVRRGRVGRDGHHPADAVDAGRLLERREPRTVPETYFSDFPGMWRQGDFYRINGRGGFFVWAARMPRSTATASGSARLRSTGPCWCQALRTDSSSTSTCRVASSSCHSSSSWRPAARWTTRS